jgi:hypothetical protein
VGLASLEEARRYGIADFFEPTDRPTVLEEVLPAVRETGFWEGDLAFRNFATGAAIPVHYTVFPFRDAQGAVSGYGTVTRDLTERRRQESFRDALIAFGDRLQACRDTAETGRPRAWRASRGDTVSTTTARSAPALNEAARLSSRT